MNISIAPAAAPKTLGDLTPGDIFRNQERVYLVVQTSHLAVEFRTSRRVGDVFYVRIHPSISFTLHHDAPSARIGKYLGRMETTS